MRDIILMGIIGLVLIFGTAYLDIYTNKKQQIKCEKIGGEYYRNISVDKSLCKMPIK